MSDDVAGSSPGPAVPSPQRPLDHTPVHTTDLPATPLRDRAIPATAWAEAPAALLTLGDDLPEPAVARYIRRIGPWLVWRAGPPSKGESRMWAARADDLTVTHTFAMSSDGTGTGAGPSGVTHTRFRTWKEDLRDAE